MASISVQSLFAQEYEYKGEWGTRGVANGQFIQPTGIAVDSKDNIYVNDFLGRSNIIQKFSDNGTFISGFGILGFGPGYLASPTGMEIDSEGNLFVADFGNPHNAIQKFTVNGTYLDSFGSFGIYK